MPAIGVSMGRGLSEPTKGAVGEAQAQQAQHGLAHPQVAVTQQRGQRQPQALRRREGHLQASTPLTGQKTEGPLCPSANASNGCSHQEATSACLFCCNQPRQGAARSWANHYLRPCSSRRLEGCLNHTRCLGCAPAQPQYDAVTMSLALLHPMQCVSTYFVAKKINELTCLGAISAAFSTRVRQK